MAEHKLTYGKEIIDRLLKLGKIFHYYTEKEYPVDKECGSAVDVAWLYEEGQSYPLFIFEIESKTTNTIAANPLKIFGEPNEKFENPLFFFHLLLTGGEESSRVSQLKTIFGTHNYRIYRFSLDQEVNLIKDVLSQHRRLTSSLNITDFIIEIHDTWSEIDINPIIVHFEELGFEKNSGSILPSYALLTKRYQEIKKHFIRNLRRKIEIPKDLFIPDNYNTYLGQQWSIPIYLGMLSAFAEDGFEKKYFEAFKNWQEKSFYLKQIGPSFGLSRDYDLFVLGMAGSMLALVASLFYKVEESREYIAKQLYDILLISEKKFHPQVNIFNALWLLFITPDTIDGREFFNYYRSFINDNGGIPKAVLISPITNYIPFIEGEISLEEYGEKIEIPFWDEFQKIRKRSNRNPNILFEIAINSLIDNDENWNPILAEQL